MSATATGTGYLTPTRTEREPPVHSSRGIIFRGRDLGAQVGDAIIDGTLERTIEGASTLTLVIHDRERTLPHSDLFSSAVEIQLDAMYFTLTGGSKSGHDFTYTFEESEIAQMRLDRSFMSADRAKVTRAEFIKSMVAEARLHGDQIPFICPELDQTQPITSSRTNPTHQHVAITAGARALRRRHRKPGVFLNPSHFTIRGAPATAQELHNLEVVMDVCAAIRAPANATRAAVMVPIEEDQARNSTVMLDHTSIGMYQILTSTAAAAGIRDRNDIAACCHAFLTRGFTGRGGAIALARQGLSPGEIGTAVQGGITQPAQYAPYLAEADRIIAAYNGGLLPTGVGSNPDSVYGATTSYTKIKRYRFTRGQQGKRENTWTAGLRLAQEVGWRFFVVSGAVYYISEPDLFASEPVATLDEGTDGVDQVDYDWHPRKRASTLTVTAHIGRWKVPPGAVLEIPKGTFGDQVDGRWLVSTISRPLFKDLATITCKQPSKELPEPPNATEQVTVSIPSRAGALTGADLSYGSGSGGDLRKRIVEIALREWQDYGGAYPYTQARPYPSSIVNARHQGTDCSGFASLVYKAAGAPDPNGAGYSGQGYTGTLASHGQRTDRPLPGDLVFYGTAPFHHVTVYVGNGLCVSHGSPGIHHYSDHTSPGFAGYWTYPFLS